MKTKLILSMGILSAMLLSGCGGGSSSDGGSDGGDSLDFTPIVNYTVDATQTYDGKTFITKLGADGVFQAVKTSGYPNINFINGVTQITIVNMTAEEKFSGTLSDGDKISATTNYDYKQGTEHTVGTSSQHGSVDCTTTYQTPLPLVVVDNGYIEIPDGFDESTKISSTCPDWMDESQNLEATSMKYLSNVTITDSDNQVSHISTYNEL
jgi:hypothetical protein